MKHVRCISMIIAILMQLMIVSAGYAYGAGTTVGVSSNSSVESATVQTEDGKDSSASLSAINGTWRGKDTLGDIQVTIIAGELIIISHPGSDQPHEAGVMTFNGSTINATFNNGTKKACRYLISNNTMTFTDETLQSSVVLTRVPEDTALSADEAKLMGTWGCANNDTYVEVTFTQGGKMFVAIPSEDGLIHEYVYAIDGHTLYVSRDNEIEVAEIKFSGDNFLLSEDGHNGTFTRRPGPLQRMESDPETAPTLEDAAVLGTWGGEQNNLYVEWTFHGDGTFERYVPQDDTLSYEGVYTARNGQMTMTVKNAATRAQYMAYESIIGISFSETDSFGYYRKTGPLIRNITSEEKMPKNN
jgi:hypothetical protein